jgi:hypothetical protein
MNEKEMSLHLLLEPCLLLHHPLGIEMKTNFILKTSCLAVGVNFARNTMRKVIVR